MVTNHTPYRECINRGAVYKKVIEGIYPRDINRILDEDVKSFIIMCISPVSERPTSSEILQHEFLTAETDSESRGKPVPLAEELEDLVTPRRMATDFDPADWDAM